MRWFIILVLIPITGVLSWFLGEHLSLSELQVSLEHISTFSAAVLAIVGIWIALTFPSVLGAVFSDDAEKLEKLKEASRLLYPLVATAVVAVTALGLQIATLVFDVRVFADFGVEGYARALACFGILLLFEASVLSLLWAIAPGIELVYRERTKARKEEMAARIRNRS